MSHADVAVSATPASNAAAPSAAPASRRGVISVRRGTCRYVDKFVEFGVRTGVGSAAPSAARWLAITTAAPDSAIASWTRAAFAGS
jgi:hypothetical protein